MIGFGYRGGGRKGMAARMSQPKKVRTKKAKQQPSKFKFPKLK